MNELERYQRAVGAAQSALRDVQNTANTGALIHLAQETLKYVDDILNPPPVYEEVEITRWECCNCLHVTGDQPEPPDYNYCCKKEAGFTLLTGTRRVEKPQPRERSAEGKVYGAGDGRNNVVFVTGEAIPVGTPVKVTWQE